MVSVMDGLTLPPDLERFVAEAVAAGRYRNADEVLAAGLGLLRRTEMLRDELRASVLAAQDQGERDGFLSIEDVMRDADSMLEKMAGPQG